MGVRLFLGKRADFEGGQITSDAGGLLLRELGDRSVSYHFAINR